MEQLHSETLELANLVLSSAQELTLATVRRDGTPHASTINFASDNLTLYAAISIDGGKAHDLTGDARVALTVNAPYQTWSEIQGMSIEGRAQFITAPEELSLASALLLLKFPEYETIIQDTHVLPWPGMILVRITPVRVLLLDYTRGFGHTEAFEVPGQPT